MTDKDAKLEALLKSVKKEASVWPPWLQSDDLRRELKRSAPEAPVVEPAANPAAVEEPEAQ